jgi:peptide/nickel transport system permease protein
MMLDQNENSEQLALIKMKYGFWQNPLLPSIYYLNDLSLFHYIAKQNQITRIWAKENTMRQPIQFLNELVIKTPYLRKVSKKAERKYLR